MNLLEECKDIIKKEIDYYNKKKKFYEKKLRRYSKLIISKQKNSLSYNKCLEKIKEAENFLSKPFGIK